jgi:hypothetical protein
MELEIKHLAAYLPYRLKIRVFREDQIIFIEDLDINGEVIDYIFERNEFSKNIYKPILRPLSDLTKEIEVNGERFVPAKLYSYLRFEEISTFKGGSRELEFIQAREYNILLALHFDIFNLIPNNLAIDINIYENQNLLK